MRFYLDRDRNYFVSSPGSPEKVTTAEGKRGDSLAIEVVFCRGITREELPDGSTGVLGMKRDGDYDGDYVAAALEWEKLGAGESAVYVFNINLNTAELNELLGIGPGADLEKVEVMMELQVTVDDWVASSNTVRFTIHNDVVRGGEGLPPAGPGAGDVIGAYAILYTGPQALTGPQQEQARTNMSLGTASTLDWATGGDVVNDPDKLARYAGDASLSAAILIAKRPDADGMLGIENVGGFSAVITSSQLTAHRYIGLPNAGGTLALCSSNTGQIVIGDLSNFSSSTLRGKLTDPTGTGAAVFSTSPTFVTPVLGVAAATSLTTNTVTPTANNRLSIIANNPAAGAMVLGNTGGANCYASFDLLTYLGVQGGGFGLANPSAGAFPNSVYFYGVGDLFLQGGSTKMKIVASSGSFLFGTETDNGARLQVAGSMTVSGIVTFADQLTLTAQTASTPTAAMTRALTEEIAGLTPFAVTDLNAGASYNGSNQVNRWFFQSAETPQGGDIAPTTAIVKGTVGPKITAGNSTAVFMARGGDTEPRTLLVVCRVLGSGAGQGRIRHRSWNLFANSGVVWLTVGSGGSHRTLATGTWDTSKVVIAAWSGNASVTRGGLWHNGTFTTGNYAGPVNYDSNGGQLVDLGAGAGGAAGDIEIAAIKMFGGCATEAQIRALLATEAKLWT